MTIAQLHHAARGHAARQITAGRLSIKLIAQRMHCSPALVSNYVRGHRNLSVETLSSFLTACGLAVDVYKAEEQRQPRSARPCTQRWKVAPSDVQV